MYVIRRRRKGKRPGAEIGYVTLTPIIAQSRRVNGKPKQEHIACLPSIIESHINDENVLYWAAVEKQLARLTNRISREDVEKVRAALDKVVPRPEPEYAKKYEDEWRVERESIAAAFGSNDGVRETNKQIHAFSSSFKTAQACADCGGEMEEVYRERRSFGGGFFGGTRWAVGVLCKKCVQSTYRFGSYGPCETCEREVYISNSIPAQIAFCSTRCGQAYYRKARRARGPLTGRSPAG